MVHYLTATNSSHPAMYVPWPLSHMRVVSVSPTTCPWFGRVVCFDQEHVAELALLA